MYGSRAKKPLETTIPISRAISGRGSCSSNSSRVLTQSYHHESSRDAKGQRVALLLGVNATLLSWKPQHTIYKFNIYTILFAYFTFCDQLWCTSEDGGDDGGQQTAGIDGQVEDGEERAPLLLLLDTGSLDKTHAP